MDSKVASTVNMMPVTLKARALTSKFYSLGFSPVRLTSLLVGTRHLKILVTAPRLNTAKRHTNNTNRATAKRVVIPMLLMILTRHRGKKVNVV